MKKKTDRLTRKGRFLSLILRHKPETLDIKLDGEGWANVSELIDSGEFDMELLNKIVELNNKKRYAFNEDKTKIRALQGHSVSVNLNLIPVEPPFFLYHGTAQRFVESIFKTGINKGSRNHVHLSETLDTAIDVGKRRDNAPTVLRVSAKRMWKDGHKFYKSENGVWLTDFVKKEYLYEL